MAIALNKLVVPCLLNSDLALEFALECHGQVPRKVLVILVEYFYGDGSPLFLR